MDVEALAVSKISSMLGICPNLKAFITTNDKTPLTDGHIDVYSSMQQTNVHLRGRVPVQVKGRSRNAKKPLSTFRIDRAVLLAYQRTSGVLYFVVTFDKHARPKPFYALLGPFVIAAHLRTAAAGQEGVPIPMKALPKDPAAIERIVALALKMREQPIEPKFDPILFENLQSLTVHAAAPLDLTAPITLSPGSTDFALVLHTADGLSVPLAGDLQLFPSDYLDRDLELRISCGTTAYDRATVRRIDSTVVQARLSDGLTLELTKLDDAQAANVHLTLEETLAGRLKSIEFFAALIDTRLIEVDGRPWPLEVNNPNDDPWLRRHLDALRRLADLFEHLGVDTRLVDVNKVDVAQGRQLNVLHRALVLGEQIQDSGLTTSPGLQAVGDAHVLFVATPGDGPGLWQLADPFSRSSQASFRWASTGWDGGDADGDADAEVRITPYELLKREELCAVLNAKFDLMPAAYEAIADLPHTFAMANERVLALITAADSCTRRDGELLDAAGRLNDWLVSKQGNEPQHLINGWQISARQRGLTDEQLSEIRGLRRRVAHSQTSGTEVDVEVVELACALLLGDKDEVAFLVAQLPAEKLDRVRSWPLWKLSDSRSEP